MDIEQGSGNGEPASDPGRQIILPGDALPGTLHVIGQENRPFFPGQAIPLVMDAALWLPTLKAVRENGTDLIGTIATRHALREPPRPEDLHEVGTLCRIHRIHREGDQLQVLLEGVQRFRVRSWLRKELPLVAQVRYFPDRAHQDAEPDELKAYAVAVINTIK